MMLINNINPDLLVFGPFSIRFYGLVYALGFLLVLYVMERYAEKRRLDKEKIANLIIYGLIVSLIGARLFHVLSDFHLYQDNLIAVLFIWNGGLGFQGGLVAGFLFALYYCRKHKINLLRTSDLILTMMPLIIGFGRIANYINSEHYGPPTSLPWCVRFFLVDGPGTEVCRHPTMLYQAIAQFMLFFVMLYFYKKHNKKGRNTAIFLIGYGFIRLTTDLLRIYPYRLFGLSHTQILGAITVFVGVGLLYWLSSSKK